MPDLHEKNLDDQKDISKEMLSSLIYAEQIQKALLPDNQMFKQHFPDSFLIFRPRDIIGGDFYWIAFKPPYKFIAVADCTGHGVPGALMSIMGISFLNEIMASNHPFLAGSILNILREKVMKALNQKGEDTDLKDGMDFSLCIFNSENHELQFSGANHQLYIISNNELKSIKGDRMPIGVNAIEESSFRTHKVKMNLNDKLYLFSDGYVDQFGGSNDRKFMYKRFRKMFLKNASYKMEKQKKNILLEFETWKKDFPQVDDIIITGIDFSETMFSSG